MNFRHKIERVNINGLKEFSVDYYHAETLLIGRGASCQIRLQSRSIAVQHARIQTKNGKLTLEDLTNSRSVRVNGKPIKVRELKDGDEVQIGETKFKTFFDGTYWGFHEVRTEVVQTSPEDLVKRQLKHLDLSRFYPSFTSLSLLAMLVTFFYFFVEPVQGTKRALWSSGPISNVHHPISENCSTCHTKPFVPVRDQECMSCHHMTDHTQVMPAVMKGHPEMDLRCGGCHIEHNGGLKPVETSSRLCTNCHGNLEPVLKSVQEKATGEVKVPSFDRHPEFKVSLVKFEGGKPVVVRESLRLGSDLKDTTKLKLNHKKHLERDLRGLPEGKSALSCMDCHELTENRKDIKPIAFDKHCRSCHPLGFDERLPATEVPHGKSDAVFNFVYAEYAKLFLVSKPESERMATVRRFKPGATVISEPDIQFTRSFVASESRNAEQTLFTRTACKLCHEIDEKAAHADGETAFEVVKPNIPVRWMPASVFDHGAHQSLTCESCHAARISTKTEDVLMPKAESCKACHTGSAANTKKVNSPCSSCHSFHDQLLFGDKEKKKIHELLLGL